MAGGFAHGAAWWNSEAVCPFYRHLRPESREIVCEGIAGAAVTTALRFRAAAEAEAYLGKYCADMEGCAFCPIYRMANERYDEHGNRKEAL